MPEEVQEESFKKLVREHETALVLSEEGLDKVLQRDCWITSW